MKNLCLLFLCFFLMVSASEAADQPVLLTIAADKLIVIGHKNPDTDAVVSAITYAHLKNAMGVKEATPAAAGRLNNETRFVLDYFKVPYPETITDCQYRCPKVILVDHGDMAQAADNLDRENVVEVVDHHRINSLTTSKAIFYLNEPVGRLPESSRISMSRTGFPSAGR